MKVDHLMNDKIALRILCYTLESSYRKTSFKMDKEEKRGEKGSSCDGDVLSGWRM